VKKENFKVPKDEGGLVFAFGIVKVLVWLTLLEETDSLAVALLAVRPAEPRLGGSLS